MIRFITLIFALLFSLNAFAQLEIQKDSFKEVPGFVNLNRDKMDDDNGKPYAVLKIKTVNINGKQRRELNFGGDLRTYFETEYKDGEVWLYISYYATFIKISHDDLSSTEFYFPFDMQPKKGYELTLVNKTSIIPEKIKYNYLTIKADQPNASIYIDEDFVGEGEAFKSFRTGEKHKWRIECELFHPENGEVEISETDNVIIDKKLRPAYGYLNITSTPENGAIVYIDGKKVGQTPYISDKLASGEHKVRVMKEMFMTTEKPFIVNDNKTTEAILNMTSDFTLVNITTDPDSDIYIDDQKKGKGSWSGRLKDGLHSFEARKQSHKSAIKNVEIKLGKDEYIIIPNPEPIYGTLDVVSDPIGATIIIDGKSLGVTPKILNNVLIGYHEIMLKKDGYNTITKTIYIDETNQISLNEKLIKTEKNKNSIAETQKSSLPMPCPMDPNVRVGKLDNGLTYYIRHNEKPAQRADFYIAQKVGSVLEEENQRGLAHFLEHMAFNGTTNLPGMMLREYLQSRGIKFGENLNAGTGIDQTVYMVTNVPTNLPGLVDTCLLILHDWSSFIALEEAEIDNERGVILEELRTREDASERIMKEILPVMYPNSPYANRLPGGLPEVVANFEYQTLRDYYHKWYRPDLQGLIIVGDIDVDAIEARIKEMFADIKAPVDPAPRPQFMIEDNVEPIVAIASDPEATNYKVNLYYKTEATPDSLKNDVQYWMGQYILSIISSMEINRLQDITQKANPPFVYGYSYYSNYYIAPTEDAWCSIAMAKDAAGLDEALTALITENNRMAQFGFTASEYERAKADFLKRIESQYNERNNTENRVYVNECLENFLSNEPIMGIETEYALYQQIIPNLPLEAINMFAKQLVHNDNLVITVTAPKKEGETLPTVEEILKIYETANAAEVQPYEEEVFDGPMVENMPKPGKIKKEQDLPEFDAKILTLSNGMKVIYKKTNFKEDEIRVRAVSDGGISVLKQEDYITLSNLDDVITLGGVGNFSATDLPKVLAGKKVSGAPYISTYSEGMNGSCSPKDLETMMQLIYLYFTAPRADEEAFQSYAQRTKAALENQELNPMITFSDSLIKVMYNNHPLRMRTKAADIDKINYAKAMKLYKDRFADPNNFTFYFVGNIDEATFRPLVEQYLASFKKNKRKESWKDINLSIPENDYICKYEKDMQNPKATIYMIMNGEMQYTYRNQLYMKALSDIMDIYYTRTIREEEGGTYGVGVMGQVSDKPKNAFLFLVAFDTNKEMHEKLMNKVYEGLNDVAENGPAQEDLTKVVENLYKKRNEQLEENSFWLSAIDTFQEDKINMIAEYDEIVKSMTPQTIAEFAKEILKGYKKEIVQLPTE